MTPSVNQMAGEGNLGVFFQNNETSPGIKSLDVVTGVAEEILATDETSGVIMPTTNLEGWQVNRVVRNFVGTIKASAGNITRTAKELKREITVLGLALQRPECPLKAKVLGAITVGYALSPIDLIPDFIPVLGYLDDIILLPLLIKGTIKLIPNELMEECREQAREMERLKKNNRVAGAIFITIWCVMSVALVRFSWGIYKDFA